MTQLPVHLGQQPHAGGAGMTYTIIGKCRKNGTIVVPFFLDDPSSSARRCGRVGALNKKEPRPERPKRGK